RATSATRAFPSFDDLVGAGEKRWRHVETKRFRGFKIEHERKFVGLDDRQIANFFALEDSSGINAGVAEDFAEIGAIAHESTIVDELAPFIHHRHARARRERE